MWLIKEQKIEIIQRKGDVNFLTNVFTGKKKEKIAPSDERYELCKKLYSTFKKRSSAKDAKDAILNDALALRGE